MSIPDITTLFLDLLSPSSTNLQSTTPQLISYHLSTVSINSTTSASLLTSLVQHISTSPSLWRGQASKSKDGWPIINWTRAQEVYEAVSNGILYRAGVITTELGTGWRARRRYATFFDHYYAGLREEGHPVLKLLLTSAPLAALQHVKNRKEKLYVGGSTLMGRAEEEVVRAWEEYLEAQNGTDYGREDQEDKLPAWLAAQTLPMMSLDTLQMGPLHSLLQLLFHSYSSAFSHGELFSSLSLDLSETSSGLHWNVPSPSFDLLTSITSNPLFISLGPLSRAFGRCIEASGKKGDEKTIESVKTVLDGIERVTSRIQGGWRNNKWSEVDDEFDLDQETRKNTLPWNILKNLLFSLTLIQSSLLVIITPKTSGPTDLQLSLASQALKTLSSTYFITIKFGPDGFGAWKGVWTGLVEIVRSDESRAEATMRELEPITLGTVHEKIVERASATFYLNVAEQVMKHLSDGYVESAVLRCCYPYLENPQYRDAFESAHSVLLAIFVSEKKVANELAPWYTDLLLKAYPDLMSTSQLRLAFTTMIRCVSNSDDALAWHCILQLVSAINAIPLSNSQSAVTSSGPPHSEASAKESVPSITPAIESLSASDVNLTVNPNIPREYDDEAATTRLDEASSLSPLETQALQLRRGHLLLTLIDQTTAVNLVLLRSLLEKIWEFVKEEGIEVDSKALSEVLKETKTTAETGREALIRVVFNTLGEGLDATKREEGVRWWMERGQELARPDTV